MVTEVKKALEQAIKKYPGNPPKIKEFMEDYFHTRGYDRRYAFKWRALTASASSGTFEFYGRLYWYFLAGIDKETLVISYE